MKKIKNKLIKQNKFETSLTDNNLLQNLFPNKNLLTEFKDSNNSKNQSSKFNKTAISFNKSKHSGFIDTTKLSEFAKTSYDITIFPKKMKLNGRYAKTINKTISNSHDAKEIFPYINLTKGKFKKNPNLLKSNKLSNIKGNNKIEKGNDRLANIKAIFSKNENQNGEFLKDLKKMDDNKYKYSIMLKNLDIWDKDHCEDNKIDSTANLFKILYKYFEENNLTKEKNDLIYASNVIKSRHENNYDTDERKQDNKIFMDIIKRKQKESGTILKNNLYKTQLKFSELFDKKYTKAFGENLDIDPDTFNLLLEDEMKNMFYNQIIKDRIKYEKQLHEEIMKINNIIYKRKNSKDEKTLKIKELYVELAKLKKEYNDKYTKNRKAYWSRYDSYEHYYKSLMTNGNMLIPKEGERDDFLETPSHLSIKKPEIEERKSLYNSPVPKKRRTSIVDKHTLSIYKNHMKRLEDEKKFKLLHMNNEMNSKLREIENIYGEKIDKIISEQKRLENDIKIHKLETNYYKKINDELVREHKVYYMNKLKKGYDCRKDGLAWIVYNLLELQVRLEYHHFPKYLTHEQIDYIIKYSKLQLKQDELKIIINALKKKQNTQKMKDALKMMDVIDNIIDVDNNAKLEASEEDIYVNQDFLKSKMKIDKKFFKIYQENFDLMKNYLFKNVESYELNKIINEFKKDLYHGSNSDINKSKRDVLNVFMGDKNNKNFFKFLVDIRANYQRIEDEKEKLFENQKKNYLKLVESNMNHKASIDNVVKNEMIKRCLFGNRLE